MAETLGLDIVFDYYCQENPRLNDALMETLLRPRW